MATDLAHIEVHAPGVRPTPILPNYNPSAPCTLGMQWMPSSDQFAFIDSELNAAAFALVADTDDPIDTVWPMIGLWCGRQSVSLEIYDITLGPPPLPALTWQTFYPAADRYVAPSNWTPGTWGPHNGWSVTAGGDMWAALDSPSLTPYTWTLSGQPVDNDQFIFNYFGYGYDFAVGHGGTSGTMAGRWITRIRSIFTVAQYFAYDRPGGISFTPYVWLNGRKFFGTPQTITAAQGPVVLYYDWYVNPSTGLPWTPADIDGFDGALLGANNGLGFKMNPTGSANNLGTILSAQLQVESAATDPRLAMAARTRPAGGDKGGVGNCKQGWMPFALKDTQTGLATSFTPFVGGKYLFVFRKDTMELNTTLGFACISDSLSRRDAGNAQGVVGNAPLDLSLQELGPPHWTTYSGPLAQGAGKRAGQIGRGVRLDGASRRVVDLGIETGVAPGIALEIAGGSAMSRDSQPYASTSPVDGQDPWPDLGEWFDNSPINSGRSMQQEITATATDDYGWVTVLCAQVAGVTDGDLEIRVRRRSDDLQMGGTVVITSEDLTPPRHAWQKVGARLPGVAPTLVAGTQYYLEITSTASPEAGWLVQCVNSGYEPNPYGPPAGTNAAGGFGAGVDKLTFGDPLMRQFGFTPPSDPGSVVALVNLATVPDAPADFAATAQDPACCLNYTTLSWTPPVSVPCGGFGAYELQRDHGSGVWRTIAYITDQDVSYFDDYEARLNIEEAYRMRLIRGDGSPSDWTSTERATCASDCCGLSFTSNEAPELSLFYADIQGERAYDYPTYDQTFAPHDRNYYLVFRELEDRGTTFKAKLRVRSGRNSPAAAAWNDFCRANCDDSAGIGDAVFDPLRNLSRAGLSYVCVKDEVGGRWFAYFRVTQGQWRQHGSERSGGWASYTADIEVTEVTDVPSAPDAQAAS